MTNLLAIQIGVSILGIFAGAILILFGMQKTHDKVNWLLIGSGAAISIITILAVLILPVNYLLGFMFGLAVLSAGSSNLYRAVRYPENSFMWPRIPFIWKAYKPVSERVLGTEGRKLVTRSAQFIGAVFVIGIGLAILIGVVSSWLSSR